MTIEPSLSHLIGEINLYITKAVLGPVPTPNGIFFHIEL